MNICGIYGTMNYRGLIWKMANETEAKLRTMYDNGDMVVETYRKNLDGLTRWVYQSEMLIKNGKADQIREMEIVA